MTNEEKILEMLTKMQADIDALKKKLNVQVEETPEQYAARKKALIEFINKPLTPEEKKDADEFAEYIAALDAKRRFYKTRKNFKGAKIYERICND